MKTSVLTRVDFATFEGVEWVNYDQDMHEAYCSRCAVREEIPLPREAVQFAQRFRTFALAHAECKVVQEVIDTEWRTRRRVSRYE